MEWLQERLQGNELIKQQLQKFPPDSSRRSLSPILKRLKRLGEKGKYGVVYEEKFHYDPKHPKSLLKVRLAFKQANAKDPWDESEFEDSLYELYGLLLVSKLIQYKICPNYTLFTHAFMTDTVVTKTNKKLQGYPKTKMKTNQLIIIQEKAQNTLMNYFDLQEKKQIGDSKMLSILFQTLMAIVSLVSVKSVHNDLYLRNIFYKKVPVKSFITYQLGYQKYKCPTYGMFIQLGDFGFFTNEWIEKQSDLEEDPHDRNDPSKKLPSFKERPDPRNWDAISYYYQLSPYVRDLLSMLISFLSDILETSLYSEKIGNFLMDWFLSLLKSTARLSNFKQKDLIDEIRFRFSPQQLARYGLDPDIFLSPKEKNNNQDDAFQVIPSAEMINKIQKALSTEIYDWHNKLSKLFFNNQKSTQVTKQGADNNKRVRFAGPNQVTFFTKFLSTKQTEKKGKKQSISKYCVLVERLNRHTNYLFDKDTSQVEFIGWNSKEGGHLWILLRHHNNSSYATISGTTNGLRFSQLKSVDENAISSLVELKKSKGFSDNNSMSKQLDEALFDRESWDDAVDRCV